MGAVTDALARAATRAGAELVTNAGVSAIRADDDGAEVTWHDGRSSRTVRGRYVLSNVAPWVLQILLGEQEDATSKPQGSQLKINLLLDRLPRLRAGIDPEVAFAGTLHLAQDYSQLEAAYREAAEGRVPSVMPGEVYCHTLTDPSILGGAQAGMHTLTYFGVHTPAALFTSDPEGARRRAVDRALATLDEHLAESIASVVATDASGRPCIEVKIPQDIERELAMPGGHIYHGDLEWPWAPNRARMDTPAQQWGVQTDISSVLVCGAGSRRGGAVSGLGGHSAAHAVLASR
jgi:phytoene dehydrogenase-like protein